MKKCLEMTGKALLLLLLLSCSKKGEEDVGSGEKGYATGKVTNKDGSPAIAVLGYKE